MTKATRAARPRLLVAGVSLLIVFSATGATPAEAHYPLKGKKCHKSIQHEPGTDWTSYDIKVRSLSCRKVRRWIRKDRGDWSAVPRRFNCVRRTHNEGLTHSDYKCVDRRTDEALRWATS